MNCDGLKQNVRKPRSSCGGTDSRRTPHLGGARVVGEDGAHAAHHLERVGVPAGRGHRLAEPRHLLVGGLPEGMERVAVSNEAPQQAVVQRRAAQPDRRTTRAEGLRLEVDVGEGVVAAVERRGTLPPERGPRGQVLVDEVAARLPRHAHRLVLGAEPADGGLHDEPAGGEQVEGRELLRQEQRVAQGRDDRRRDEPDALRRRRDRRQHHDGARPGGGRILVAHQGILARVRRAASGVRAGREDDVLAEHDGIDARLLGLDGSADERPQVALGPQRGVLAEDHHHPDRQVRARGAAHVATPSTRRAFPS